MDENRDIAYFGGKYHGQYQFTGRLKKAITVVPDIDSLYNWAGQHQGGYIIVTYKDEEALSPSLTDHHYPFKGQNIGLLSCQALLANSGLRTILKP